MAISLSMWPPRRRPNPDTGDAPLIYDAAKPRKSNTSLPASRFTAMLTRIHLELNEAPESQ